MQPRQYFEHHLNAVKESLVLEGYEDEVQDEILLNLVRSITNKVAEGYDGDSRMKVRKYLAEAAYPILEPLLSRPLEEVLKDG